MKKTPSTYKYHQSEYLVAFIDVLGAKQKISENSEEALNVIHDAYDEAIGLFRNIREKNPKITYMQGMKYKIFSDNIILALPMRKDINRMIHALSILCSLIQISFLKREMLTRGGMALGAFFCDDVMVWGDALVIAYQLEAHEAKYPRIVLDGKLLSFSEYRESDFHQMIRKDNVDGRYFVNYLNDLIKDLWLFICSLGDFEQEYLGKAQEYDKKWNRNSSISQGNSYSAVEKIKWYIDYSNQRLNECGIIPLNMNK